MSRHTLLIVTLTLAVLVAYVSAWLVLGAFLTANSSGGWVMLLLCYWLSLALVSAVGGALLWIVACLLAMAFREDREE